MKTVFSKLAAAAACTLALGGCANNNNALSTAALPANAPSKVAAAPKYNPACVTLTAKMDELRKEGSAARLAAVANGKTRSVSVKRASLAKAAELDQANTEFQTKCTNYRPAVAMAAPAPAAPATKAVKKAATKKVTKKVVAAAAAKAPVAPATPEAAKPAAAAANIITTTAMPAQ